MQTLVVKNTFLHIEDSCKTGLSFGHTSSRRCLTPDPRGTSHSVQAIYTNDGSGWSRLGKTASEGEVPAYTGRAEISCLESQCSKGSGSSSVSDGNSGLRMVDTPSTKKSQIMRGRWSDCSDPSLFADGLDDWLVECINGHEDGAAGQVIQPSLRQKQQFRNDDNHIMENGAHDDRACMGSMDFIAPRARGMGQAKMSRGQPSMEVPLLSRPIDAMNNAGEVLPCAIEQERNWSRGEAKTTVVFRNLPTMYTRSMLLELLDSNSFARTYDFVYLVLRDLKSGAGAGFAFVNFIEPRHADRAHQHFDGFRLEPKKTIVLGWANPRQQGLEANIEQYRNSVVMHRSVREEHKPLMLVRGLPVMFPRNNLKVKAALNILKPCTLEVRARDS